MVKRIFILLVSVLVLLSDRVIDLLSNLVGKRRASLVTVLVYHSVSPRHRARFSWQMQLLNQLTHPITVNSMDANRDESGKHYVIVTFDDGLENFLSVPLPELQANAIPVALFVPVDYLGRSPDWMNARESTREGPEPVGQVMTAEQLRLLPHDLVTVGAHSMSHQDLRVIGDDRCSYELSESKRQLEELLKRDVQLVAFPYNSYTARTAQLALMAGYRRCFAGHRKCPLGDIDDSYVTSRISVSTNDWKIEFLLKILGAYRWRHLACRFMDLYTVTWHSFRKLLISQ